MQAIDADKLSLWLVFCLFCFFLPFDLEITPILPNLSVYSFAERCSISRSWDF